MFYRFPPISPLRFILINVDLRMARFSTLKTSLTNPVLFSVRCKNQVKQLKVTHFFFFLKETMRTGVILQSWMSHSFWAAVPWQCSWKGAVKCAQTEGLRKSWKIGVMPNFLLGLSFLLSLSLFSPLSANTLCDKYQMRGPFSRRHHAFFSPFTL